MASSKKQALKPDQLIPKIINLFGGRFSRQLGLNLSQGSSSEIFKWFLAAKLYGARISSEIASRTFHQFSLHGISSPEKIIEAGWEKLVSLLDQGGYVRYDFSTASRLLAICQNLINWYQGDLNRLHDLATNGADLEKRLRELGKGIGPITIQIFLRELRFIWAKAQPPLSSPAQLAAKKLALIKERGDPLQQLLSCWQAQGYSVTDFPDLEAALLRLGLKYCRPSRCSFCPLKRDCPSAKLNADKKSSPQQSS